VERRAKPTQRDTPKMITVVGPPTSAVGGIATVIGQMNDLDISRQYRIQHFETTHRDGPTESLVARSRRHLRRLFDLRRVLRSSQSPITHIHTCSGFSFFRSVLDMLIAQFAGSHAVLHIHGAAFNEFFANLGFLGRRFVRWSLARADAVIALSCAWQESIARMSPHAKIHVIENAVEMPAEHHAVHHLGPCRLLLLARMDHWKGIDDLLYACERLHNEKVKFELTLAGPEGSAGNAQTLNQKIVAAGLDGVVRYAGEVRGKHKTELLEWADVYVVASHHEGLPISLLEALAYKLAVVATAVGAIPEIITDRRQGLLVPPHSPDTLAVALREVINQPERREFLAEQGYVLAKKRFGLKRFANQLVTLYDRLSGYPVVIHESSSLQTTLFPSFNEPPHQSSDAHSLFDN